MASDLVAAPVSAVEGLDCPSPLRPPADAAAQVGASGAALIAAGVEPSQALAVALSVAALGIFCGAAILLFAVAWRTGLSLAPARAAV